MQTPSPFELAGHQNPEIKITHDASRLSDGARGVLETFNDADRKRIKSAKRLNISEAMIGLPSRGVTALDIELAELVSGLERGNAPESAKVEFLRTINAAYSALGMEWLKNLRKSVKHILASEQRAEGRGFDRNVVNEDDHLTLCHFAQQKLESFQQVRPQLFLLETEIVEVKQTSNGASLSILDERTFKARLERYVPFRKSQGDKGGYIGVEAPNGVTGFVYREPTLSLPRLNGIVRAPIYTADAVLVTTPGYHPSGYYYAPPAGFVIEPLPAKITDADVMAAIADFVEILGDFEMDGVSRAELEAAVFEGKGEVPASFVNALGWMLEQIVRPMIDGPVMPLVVSKTAPGAGGGRLVEIMQVIVEGQSRPRPMSKDEEERKKAIFSALSTGVSVMSWDNLPPVELDSAALAMLWTERTWTDRILGRSAERALTVSCSFVLVGNRPVFSDELRRRLQLIELLPQCADPELRTGWKIDAPERHARKHRAKYVRSLLIMVQNWIQKGRYDAKLAPVIGRYEEHTRIIGGIMEAAGFSTWQANKAKMDKVASNDAELEVIELWEAWALEGIGTKFETDALCSLAALRKISLPVAKAPQGDEYEYKARAMTSYLKTFEGRIFRLEDGREVKLTRHDKRGKTGYPWRLDLVQKQTKAKAVLLTKESNVVSLPAKPLNALQRAAVASGTGERRGRRGLR
jgi:hypothetical protein